MFDTWAPFHLQGKANYGAEVEHGDSRHKLPNSASTKLLRTVTHFWCLLLRRWVRGDREPKTFYKELAAKVVIISSDPKAGSYFVQRISSAIQRENAASFLDIMTPF